MRSVTVTESSQIASARRLATEIAASISFDDTATGRVAIVATELATNIIKHGGGGELLLSQYENNGGGVQIIALDRGKGIANLQESLRDGHSTAGTAGHGLGAIRRQSQAMDVASWPGLGTAILVRIGHSEDAPPADPSAFYGCISIPLPGEEVCGDSCVAIETPAGRTLLVVDGLGHGPDAAIAANEAVRLFQRYRGLAVPQILEYIHAGLRHTRGAAVAIARVDTTQPTIIYGGIGNISGALVNATETRRMISLNGTAGHVARKIQTFDYAAIDGWIVMHSDGVSSNWSLDRYPGITRMNPTLISAILYRDFSRKRDDATVLIANIGMKR